MPPDPLSEADWRWLRDNFGDFVLEEPGYAPKLLARRDTRKGKVKPSDTLLSIFGIGLDKGAGGGGIIKIGQLSPKKG